MQHLSEEQLVLYFYREAEGRAGIDDHLEGCEVCRAAYQGLEVSLAAVDAYAVPERGAEYGSHVWQRLRPRLERQRAARWRPWLALAAGVVLVASAFLAGRYWPRVPQTAPAAAVPAEVRERILLVAVGDHLERSQMVLVELANAQGRGPIDISAERQRAEDLLGANRLYRQTAARAGEVALAGVLEDLERFLLEIAHSPERLSTQQIQTLRERLEQQGILFKIRVIGTQVRSRGGEGI